jgi:hypothetical protein
MVCGEAAGGKIKPSEFGEKPCASEKGQGK